MSKTKVDQAFEQTSKKEYPLRFKTGEFLFNWCCDCGLRHVNFYRLVRGEKPEDDVVEIYDARDSVATELRKYYKRCQKRKKG